MSERPSGNNKSASKDSGKERISASRCSNVSSKSVKNKLAAFVSNNEFGSDLVFKGVFGPNVVTYVDYTASGRPLRCIESYIQKHVLPTYANTHTEVSYTGEQTTTFREDARDIIRKAVNAGSDDRIIFTGSGVTSAINKLVHALDLSSSDSRVVVFIGPYEHHSNILPWLHSDAEVIRIPQDRDGRLDIATLASKLESLWASSKKEKQPPPFIIGSFSAASNVTGIITPTYNVCCLIHKYNGIVLWDYACAGPYLTIDMNPAVTTPGSKDQPYKDAVFISPHKFVGGPGTPGILVAKQWLFKNPVPHDKGGGTVLFVRRERHLYLSNPEHREEGGTPSIIESIRCGLVFKLKDTFGSKYIMKKEHFVLRQALDFLQDVEDLVVLGNPSAPRLPILSFLFYNRFTGRFVHHDFIATILNDVFGIQVRSGCACAGPYGLDLVGMGEQVAHHYEKFLTYQKSDKCHRKDASSHAARKLIYKPGFVRLSLPYFVQDDCVDFVLKSVRLTALYGWTLLPQYQYSFDSGKWSYRGNNASAGMRRLGEVSFDSGKMDLQKRLSVSCSDHSQNSDSNSTSCADDVAIDYQTILKRAEGLFYDAASGLYDCEEESNALKEMHNEELRWFMIPSEAAHLIHKRKKNVVKLKPEQLPFMPGALAAKLGINPVGHKGRGKEMDAEFPLEYFPTPSTQTRKEQ